MLIIRWTTLALGTAVSVLSLAAGAVTLAETLHLERYATQQSQAQRLSVEHNASVQDPSPTAVATGYFSHQAFDQVLRIHVVDGIVDYPAIAVDPHFTDYINQLSHANLDQLTMHKEELAFWINAYNALVIKGILDGYSPSTFFGRVRFFKMQKYKVGGAEVDLYYLEHGILIPLKDSRIHFTIVCASSSCPKLRSEAFSIDLLEMQLEQNAKEFINDSTRNRFDREQKVAYLSKIFDWFESDFKRDAGSVQAYLARYVDDPKLAQELESGLYRVKFLDYDWRLNGTPPNG